MSVLSLPSSAGIARMRWEQQRNDVMDGLQALRASDPLWRVSLELSPDLEANSGYLKALFMRLRGPVNQLELHDWARPAPVGTYRGVLSLASSVAAGATSMSIVAANDNLLSNPEALNLWGTSLVTATENATAAPDGLTTAEKLVETAATGEHHIQQTAPVPTANVQYTLSAFGKAAERSIVGLRTVFSNGASDTTMWFNLATGAISSPFNLCIPGSQILTVDSNGYFRASWRAQMPSSIPAFSLLIRAHLAVTAGAGNYAGAAGSGLYLWGLKWQAGGLTDYGHGKTLKKGDLLGIGSGTTQQVVMVTEDATSTSQGNMTVQFQPPLRNAFSAGQAVVWDKPKALFRRVSNELGWDYRGKSVITSGMAVDLIEDVRAA